jgi:FkbM family methyltransferase
MFAVYRRGGIPGLSPIGNRLWMRAGNIRTILDIGANVGQFAVTANMVLPRARIISFEPLPDCYAALRTRMARANDFQALNTAVGDSTATLAFERNGFSDSSSFLPMAEAHKRLFPFTRDSRPVEVPVARLDDLASQLPITDPLLVKIDVQGYEDRVLRGGEQTIRRARMVIVETGFEELYEGQPLFDEIYRLLVAWGFQYHSSLDQLVSPDDGRILQENSVFLRTS